MPNHLEFAFDKSSKIDETFRVQKVRSNFDYQPTAVSEHFEGQINLPEKWQIGAIVGASGTGKSTIAKELFKNDYLRSFDYSHKSVIDDMPENASFDEIVRTFYAVGFGSVPSWLKPYSVLSNGEKMRVELANHLLSSNFSVFDEFTSVVDRNVAKTMCLATKKTMTKFPEKRLVVISCHYDILDWLEPDWVFDASKNESFFGQSHEPNFTTKSGEWQKTNGESLGDIII